MDMEELKRYTRERVMDCMKDYKNKEEIVKYLKDRHEIPIALTTKVLFELENESPDFFSTYYAECFVRGAISEPDAIPSTQQRSLNIESRKEKGLCMGTQNIQSTGASSSQRAPEAASATIRAPTPMQQQPLSPKTEILKQMLSRLDQIVSKQDQIVSNQDQMLKIMNDGQTRKRKRAEQDLLIGGSEDAENAHVPRQRTE